MLMFLTPNLTIRLFRLVQGEDVYRFEKDCTLTAFSYIKRKESGMPWEENEYSIRGLEEMVRKYRHSSGDKSARDEHSQRVLKEYRRLQVAKKATTQDPSERLRAVSLHSSKAERIRAMNRAKEDASFAGHSSSRLVKKVMDKLSWKTLQQGVHLFE